MEKIENVEILPLEEGKYVIPYRMNYSQDGISKTWEAVKENESVCILIYNKTRDCFVFVSQFRPAVYYSAVRHGGGDKEKEIDMEKFPGRLGVTYELCAGLVDKAVSSAEIARMEVMEECGYDVPVDSLEVISSYRTGMGISGSYQTMYYCAVMDEQRVTPGGGVESEMIEVIDVDRERALADMVDGESSVASTVGLKYALLWFSARKNHSL